jgi:hypothetical protein
MFFAVMGFCCNICVPQVVRRFGRGFGLLARRVCKDMHESEFGRRVGRGGDGIRVIRT